MTREVRLASEGETLVAALYGEMPARRAALLCHGAGWDASGWAEVAPRFAKRGVPALALHFRGYDGSSGRTKRETVVQDVRVAVEWLREQGAAEVALVGSSLGGYAVLAASPYVDPECVVAISAPVKPIAASDAQRVKGRKLFICAERDSLGAAPAVQQAFEDANEPKQIRFFSGREHSKGLWTRHQEREEILDVIARFVAEGV